MWKLEVQLRRGDEDNDDERVVCKGIDEEV
jgi:hypothetical protein